jgi:hypothetical protein
MSRLLGTVGFGALLSLGVATSGCSKNDPGVVAVSSKKNEKDASRGDEDECPRGEETCRCRRGDADDACDEGLECRSGLCVEEGDDPGDDDMGTDADDDAVPDDDTDDDTDDDDSLTDDDAADDDADDDVATDDDDPAPAPADDDTGSADDDTGIEPDPGAGGSGNEPGPAPMGGTGNGGASPVGAAGSGGMEPVGTGGTFTNPTDNLIQNGDFSEGNLLWDVNDGTTSIVPYTITGGALCVVVDEYQTFVAIGWPLDIAEALLLDTSASYELSYHAWTNNPAYVDFEAKSGEAVSPYLEHFLEPVSLSTSGTRFSHVFTPASSEPSGIVFLVYSYGYYYSAEVCVDNVVLRRL